MKKKAEIDNRDDEQRTFTVWVPRGLHRAFKAKAATEGRSLSDFVREKMREYVGNKKP